MPYCKSCHQEISKFDTDVCPHCGTPNPIDSSYRTMDITRDFASVKGSLEDLPRTKSHKTFVTLCMTLGAFGAHNFYISRPKRALCDLLATLMMVVGLGTAFYFIFPALANAGAYFIPLGVMMLLYVLQGVFYLKQDSLKDGRGEFLR